MFCRVFSFHLEFHKGVFIVKGVNEHIENFNSEPCGAILAIGSLARR